MTKKKIGCVIIMHNGHNNYGTSLQGFATIYRIEDLGYDYEIIRYIKKRTLKQVMTEMPGLLRSGALSQICSRIKNKIDSLSLKEYKRTYQIRREAVDLFKKKYFDNKSQYYVGYEALKAGAFNYSKVMVGSDQVWSPLSLYSKFYNLIFVDKSIPKFSYASSFGVSSIFPWQKEAVGRYLSELKYIGVREQRGKEIVEELTEKKAEVVLDPTFLLTKEEWEKHIDESRCVIEKPYILCYVLGERKSIREQIKKLAKETGLTIVNLPHIDIYHEIDENLGDINLYDVDPFDFIRLIRDAKYVVTDSFHGSVFSILFHKKFLTFYRKNPNAKGSTHSRIDSLFASYGLSNRLFKENIHEEISAEIDYPSVDIKIEKMRNDSIAFLEKCLTEK